MPTCKYEFNHNGQTISISDERELVKFLKNNSDKLSNYKTLDSDVKFSKDIDPQSEAIAKINAANEESRVLTSKYDNYGNKIIIGRGYVGVTKAIDNARINGERISPEFVEENYRADRIEKTLKQYRNNGYLDHESDETLRVKINDEITTDLMNWSKLGLFGTNIHAVLDHWFKNTDKHSFEDISAIAGKNLTTNAIEKLIQALEKIESTIKLEHGDKAKVFTEFKIHDPGTKIAGIIDLLVVDAKGNAYIYDLKTSYKDIDDWSGIKTLKMKYQMALYRQLLRIKGLNVMDIRILPSTMLEIDYANNIINNLELDKFISLGSEVTEHSKIQRNARAILPTSSFSFKISNDVSKEIKEELNKNFGYEVQARGFNKRAETIKENLGEENIPDVKTGKITQKKFFFDSIKNERVYVTENNVDEKINDYLKRLSEDTAFECRNLREHIESAKKGTRIIEKYKMSISMERVNNIIADVFTRYVEDPAWSVISDGELDDLGILCFFNERTKAFEFVSITSNKLNEKIPLAIGPSILGQFLQRKATYTDTKLMDSNVKNVEFMKIASFINKYSDKFKDGSIGMIRVLNPVRTELDGIDYETLKYNYSKLCHQSKTVYKLNSIKEVDPTILVFQKINEIVDKGSNKIMSKFKDMLDSSEDILSDLITLQKGIQSEILRDGSVAKLTFRSESEELLGLVAQAIAYQTKINIPVEAGLKEWAMNNSSMLSNPGAISHKSVQNVVNYMSTAMHNIRRKQTDYKENHRQVFLDFFEGNGFSKARRYSIGDNINSYTNLFETTNGQINREMRFKNPDTDTSLNPNEKRFLTSILKTINELRYGNITPTKIMDLKASGEYFNIPLMKAGNLSKFKNQSYKDGIRDYFNDMYNYNKYFSSEDEESNVKMKTLNEMYNRFEGQLNPEVRNKMVNELNPADFETDVEAILDMLSFSRIRKQEFDRVLPVVNAIRICLKYQSYNLLKDDEITIDYIEKLIAQTAFNDKMIPNHLQTIAKMAGTLKSFTSKMNLGLNPFSGITNLLQGQWANTSRILSKEFGADTPTKDEYAKALKFIFTDVDIVNNVTTIEELGFMYGMNGNSDINRITESMSQSNTGILAMKSNWLFWTSRSPDYFNRMGLFVAQMIHDGCFEAHTMKNGKMIYDWTKDRRFSEYAAGKTNSPKYDYQRALYLKFIEEFNATSGGPGLKEGDALPYAYTPRQTASRKNAYDKAHGYYDHETKAMVNHTILGSMLLQFKTFLTSKKDQYFQKGDVYGQGDFVQMKDYDGNLLYKTEDGELTTEKTSMPVIDWQGRYMEGIWYSLVNTLEDIKEYKWNVKEIMAEAHKHPERIANFKMLTTDLSIILALTIIYNLIDWKEFKQDKPFTAALSRAVLGSGRDLFIGNNITSLGFSAKNPFASISYANDLGTSIYGILSGTETPSKIVSNVGITRPFEPLFNQ